MPPKRPWQAIYSLILPTENKTNSKSFLTAEDALAKSIEWLQQQGPDDPHRASVYVHNKDGRDLPDDELAPESYRLEWVYDYRLVLQTTWPSKTSRETMREAINFRKPVARTFKIAAVAPGGDESMVGRELGDADLAPVPETAQVHPAQPRLTLSGGQVTEEEIVTRQQRRDAALARAQASRRAQGLPDRMPKEIMEAAGRYSSEIGLTERWLRPGGRPSKLDQLRADLARSMHMRYLESSIGPAAVRDTLDRHPEIVTVQELLTVMDRRVTDLRRQWQDLAGDAENLL